MKTKLYKRIIIVVFLAVASLITSWCVEACFRTVVLLNWNNTASEWRSITRELDDIEGFRKEGLFDYNLVNPYELYAIKEYTVIDKDGNMTQQELEQLVMPVVNKANRELDGNPAMVYVGHGTPHKLKRVLFIYKPIMLFRKARAHNHNSNTNDSRWTVIVYKRARNPFLL